MDNQTIREALKLWTKKDRLVNYKKKAIEKYGHISTWQTRDVTDMSHLFQYKEKFNEDISSWDVSKVTNMRAMFFIATSFNQPLEKWDVSKVTNMRDMFAYASSFNQPLEKWDVSKVTHMGCMFDSASSFNQPLEKWDVSKVTDMGSMFYKATSFNQPLENWDVSKVTNMGYMFNSASSFNSSLLNWKFLQTSLGIYTMFDKTLLFERFKQSSNFNIDSLSAGQIVRLMSVRVLRMGFIQFLNMSNLLRVNREEFGYAERVSSMDIVNQALLAGDMEFVRSIIEYI